ncbi:FAD-dependent oxidoreductase [Vagococcus sp. DIV0080]|uniref:FAD-dependent oxidoreductase n=1 Tax=Candidatus Vagococcus giribetii TaxID=2230876 RepID=A0ABS3HUS3_9ENTE|nr:FAD-dependent oxidoreductase [Vagococcus sp. DIV0080]MBO0477416.1 FAD-dependent oxidoreductase [Vagococcus sp. DIV0080]
MVKYPNLFSPKKIKNITFRNRIFAAPSSLVWPDYYTGMPDESTVFYYEDKARGGAASVTLSETVVNRTDAARRANNDILVPDFEKNIFPTQGWLKVTDAIKRHGAVPSIQIFHSGDTSDLAWTGGRPPIGPDAFVKEDGTIVKEMDKDDMKRVASEFAESAWYAKYAGFQKVMLHGAHGWLLAQFLSPATNHRKDEYGGSLENRARFPIMVVDAVRERCGEDFLIEYRISAREYLEGGLEIDEAVEFAKMLDGKIDLLHVSAGSYYATKQYTFPSIYLPHGCNVSLAEAMKKGGVQTPIVTVGAHYNPKDMEKIIAEGKADFIAISRAIIADPQLPNKIFAGREQDVTPCLRCTNCLGGKYDGRNECDVNPLAGNELYTLRMPDVKNKRKVLVIGGGPGGMKSAITAAERGHHVTLVEKEADLGGNLKFTEKDSHKDDLRRFKDYLIHQTYKHAIDVKLNTEANLALVNDINPQDIILASGASPTVLTLKGSDQYPIYHATKVYEPSFNIRKKIVMIGGGLMGCEIAIHLAESGAQVTILEIMDSLARDSNRIHQAALFEMLEKMKDLIHIKLKVKVTEITESGLKYLDENEEEKILESDTILYAVGMRPNEEIVEEIRSWDGWESFRAIGDCTGASVVRKAIHTGYFAAMDII